MVGCGAGYVACDSVADGGYASEFACVSWCGGGVGGGAGVEFYAYCLVDGGVSGGVLVWVVAGEGGGALVPRGWLMAAPQNGMSLS